MASYWNFKKSTPPGAAPAGYVSQYFDSAGALHLVQEDGTDTVVSAQTLAALTDVAIGSPVNLQQLRYNSTTGKWENFTPSASAQKTAADRLYLHATVV
jgi:hypothetical protein